MANACKTSKPKKVCVNMPSGERFPVAIPAKACNCSTCSFNATLTLVDPALGEWASEYDQIYSDMLDTIRYHVLQNNGGGIFTSYNIMKIEKVNNPCLWRRYRDAEIRLARELDSKGKEWGFVNQQMLYHGSNAADTIVETGFDLCYSKPKGMFGKAIYFAKHSSKANQYAFGYLGGNGCPLHNNKNCHDCERKLLLCRVALGRTLKRKTADKMGQLPPGYNSVQGVASPGGLRYSEYALHNVDQAYPEYVITYKIL